MRKDDENTINQENQTLVKIQTAADIMLSVGQEE